MRLTSYGKSAQKEVDAWLRGDASLVARAMDWVMRPVDSAVEQGVPDSLVDQMSDAIGGFLSKLNDATKWAVDLSSIQSDARRHGLDIEDLED